MPGGNANTQIANLNEENLEAILAAIKVLRKRAADNQRARDRLERRSDAAADRWVKEVNELAKRVREYFDSQHQDPGGCVSDPSSESCLDHLDEIQDSAVREEFKGELKKLDTRQISEETAFNTARDVLANEERDAYADYQKTLDRLGRRFAGRAGTITGHGGVSSVPVLFNASEVLPDRLYLSTLEDPASGSNYVDNARSFHEAWGLQVIPITSLEELLDDTIRRRSKPGRVRIVLHGTSATMRLRMFKAGTIELDDELFDTFLQGTLPLFNRLTYHEGFDERQAGRLVAAAIRRDAQATEVVTTFGLRTPTRQVAAYLLYEALLRSKAYETSAGVDAALVEEVLQAITKLLRTRLRTIYGVDAATVRKLEQAVGRAVAADTGDLKLGAMQFGQLENEDLSALVGFLAKHPSIEVRIAQFQRALGDERPYVDIRGCNVGFSEGILRATAKLFATAATRVTAPNVLLGFAKVASYEGISLECDLPSIMPIPSLQEKANAAEHKLAHESPWTGAEYLKNYARFLGISRLTRGWLFEIKKTAWDDLPPQIQAAEVLYFMPFFVWLTETAVPTGTTFPSGAVTITDVRLYLDYLFDCIKRDVRSALRRLLRTGWVDAPATTLEELVNDIVSAGTATAPFLPMLDTRTLGSTRAGTQLKLGQYLFTYDPAFRNSISRG
jgi:hypothetical protein